MSDMKDAVAACKRAQRASVEIDHGTARTIASMYHEGQATIGYAFASSGVMLDVESDGVIRDLFPDGWHASASADERLLLDMLGTYLSERARNGETGPVDGWSRLWVMPRHAVTTHISAGDGITRYCEHFKSIKAARQAFAERLDNWTHGHRPSATMDVYPYTPEDDDMMCHGDYPLKRFVYGPRGGVKEESI